MTFVEDFNTLFLQHPVPSSLINRHQRGTINTLTEMLDDLQKRTEHLDLLRLQALKTINHQFRKKRGTTCPIPTDYSNNNMEKILSTINDFCNRVTENMTLTRPQILRNFPDTHMTTETIIRWNLAHNTQSYQLDQHWTGNLTRDATGDIWSLKNKVQHTVDFPTLPRTIPNAMHNIFTIDCQLNSDPIHSAFANFTHMKILVTLISRSSMDILFPYHYRHASLQNPN